MNACNPCIKTNPLPKCTQEVIIGTISDINENVNVYFWDVTTSLIQKVDSASDGAGLVTVDISELGFAASHACEAWVTLASANYKDKLDITIGSSQSKTICLRFDDVKDMEGEAVQFNSETLVEA